VAYALNAIGAYLTELGDPESALALCRESLAQYEEIGDRYGQAGAQDSLASAYRKLDRHGEAISWYRRAADLCRELGDRYNEAATLVRLGDSYAALDELGPARDAWRRGLAGLADLDHPDAELVRAKLARTSVPG
jgi:tetratricopeptide (TPR) repeat protein